MFIELTSVLCRGALIAWAFLLRGLGARFPDCAGISQLLSFARRASDMTDNELAAIAAGDGDEGNGLDVGAH
jgi:hypothetical protein